MKTKKICVFCGKKPIGKTIEHVIPIWLIEMTGDPSRIAQFGPIWNDKTKQLERRQFAFDSLKFPACKECNSTYSKLENQVKSIFQKIMQLEAITMSDASILLSWFDKVRIGMWLGLNYWRADASEIEPHMFISSRLNMTDRCLFIYRSKSLKLCLNLIGLQLPAFHYTPCCFSMIVNNVGFFNIAGDFLLSKRLGLPYPKKISWGNWPSIQYGIIPGKKQIELPLITKKYDTRCMQLYQPMAVRYCKSELWKMYTDEYARRIMIDETNGTGKVFIEYAGQFKEMSLEGNETIAKQLFLDHGEMIRILGQQTIDFQLYMHNRGPSEKTLKEPHKTIARMQRRFATSLARTLLERLKNE